MSELKAFTFGLGRYTEDGYPCVVACDGEGNPRLASDETFYLKSEADKVIAEKDEEIYNIKYSRDEWAKACNQKDKEIEELKQKLESVQASMYCDVVDANMENRRLKRALWLTRAERASDKARIFYFAEPCGVKLNIDGYSNKEKGHSRMCTARWWRLTWLKVERKCRDKAEEYK